VKYSVVTIAKNEAAGIAECIASAVGASEVIVVVDSASSDETTGIATKLGAAVFHRKLDGFAFQKNFGIDQAHNNWILVLDADERLTPELAEEITKLDPPPGVSGYQMAFRNYVGDKWLRHGGLYPDYHIRLFNRTKARYGARQVHEQLEYKGKIETLRGDVVHLTYRDFREYNQKVGYYARLEAQSDNQRPTRMFIAKTFYRKFARDRGYRDGLAGLMSALLLTRYQMIKRKAMS